MYKFFKIILITITIYFFTYPHTFANNEKIKSIKAPKLIIHSKDDEMIPVSMAEELYKNASEPKTKVFFEGPGHNDLIWRKPKELLRAIKSVLEFKK